MLRAVVVAAVVGGVRHGTGWTVDGRRSTVDE
jgi:hypothetical protein